MQIGSNAIKYDHLSKINELGSLWSEYLACVFIDLQHFEGLHVWASWIAIVVLGPCDSSVNFDWDLDVSSSIRGVGEDSKCLIFVGEVTRKVNDILIG